MGFGSFNKSNHSSTTNSTTNNYKDDSANAGGDNSVALSTGGGSLHIETLDPQVVAASLDTVKASGAEETKRYLATLESMKSDREISSRTEREIQNAANLAIQSSAGIAQRVAELSPNTDKTSVIVAAASKIGVALAVSLGAAAVLWFFTKGKNK